MKSAAARTASAVPRARSCTAISARPSTARLSGRSGESTTTTRSAPDSRAASTGQQIIGRPQSGCSNLGTRERILVP